VFYVYSDYSRCTTLTYLLFSIFIRSAKPIPVSVDTDSDDPAVWLPAIISEAENIASYCKSLTTKVGNRWLKTPTFNFGHSMNGQDYTEKARVTEICRKLRNAVNVTRMNMKKLDKAIVSRYSHSYGNTVDLDTRPKSSFSPRHDSRVILKIKNYRKETDREEEYYAEIRGSSLNSSELPPETMEGNDEEDSVSDNHLELANSAPSEDSSNSALPHPILETIEETSQPELPSEHQVDHEENQQRTSDSNVKEVEFGTPTKVEPTPSEKESVATEETPIPSAGKSSKLKLKKSIDPNKKAFHELLISSDSDDSLGDFSLSPRAKKTPKRNRPAFLGLDDPKLKAECAVVIERIDNPVLNLV
jgi:hypothetical protein